MVAHGPTDQVRESAGTRRWGVLLAVLSTVCAVLVAGAIVLGFSASAAAREDRLRLEALDTARQMAVNFTTLDYREFADDTASVRALAGGDFATQYAAASADLKELVTANEAVSKGEVLEAGTVSFDSDSARVLVVADADVVNSGAKKSQLRTYRLRMDLARIEHEWRVVDLQFVG